MAATTPERGPGRRGQQRRRGRRRHGLPRRHAHRLQHLQVGHCRRGVPGHRLTDEEQRRHQRGQREGEQAGGLVPGDPLDRLTEVLPVVPHVDVRPAGHPGQVGAERGDGRGAALQPDQRVDVVLAAGAEDVGPVTGVQGRRGLHGALLAGAVRPDGQPGAAAHPGDPGLDDGTARRPRGPVVLLVGLLRAGQEQGHGVPDALVVGGREQRGDQDLVDASGVEHPAGQHVRPLDGPAVLVADGREAGARVRAAGQREPERDRELADRGDLGQGTDLAPVEPGLVGQHGHGRRQRAGPEPLDRALPATGPRGRREHRRRGQRHQQGQHEQRPPAPPRIEPQPGHRDAHARPPYSVYSVRRICPVRSRAARRAGQVARRLAATRATGTISSRASSAHGVL